MQRPGIEPGPEPWEGSIIPLDYRCVHHFFVGYALIAGLGARWLVWLGLFFLSWFSSAYARILQFFHYWQNGVFVSAPQD